jgi:hypothetical protein
MQVAIPDLGLAAEGPLLTNCNSAASGCAGSKNPGVGTLLSNNVGYGPNGGIQGYPGSDFPGNGANASYNDTFNVIEGALPFAGRSFPNFIIPYRGGTVGQNTGCPKFSTLQTVTGQNLTYQQYMQKYYTPSSPCFIQGWERFQSLQFNLGTTRIYGKTENWFGADQIQLIGEWGLEWVPDMPAYDQLQLDAYGVNYGATAGADGSGVTNGQFNGGYRRACSTIPDCVAGPDGGRFNPHQQDPVAYPDAVSWGYRVLAIGKYNNVLPNINLQPTLLYSQDVSGTSPGPAGNFTSGAKSTMVSLETRYRSATAFTVAYTWYWGGGDYNPWADRDFLEFYLKYQF